MKNEAELVEEDREASKLVNNSSPFPDFCFPFPILLVSDFPYKKGVFVMNNTRVVGDGHHS